MFKPGTSVTLMVAWPAHRLPAGFVCEVVNVLDGGEAYEVSAWGFFDGLQHPPRTIVGRFLASEMRETTFHQLGL